MMKKLKRISKLNDKIVEVIKMQINIFVSDINNGKEKEGLSEALDVLTDVIGNLNYLNYEFKVIKAEDSIENQIDMRVENIYKSEIFILLLSTTISKYQIAEYSFAKQSSLKIIAFLEGNVDKDPILIDFMQSSGLIFIEFFGIKDLRYKFSNYLKSFLNDKSKSKEIQDSNRNNGPIQIIEFDQPKEYEWVKIGIVQINFNINKKLPYNLLIDENYIKKIENFVKIAEKMGVEILLFPELSVNQEILTKIKEFSSDMIIIAGSQYKDRYNISSILHEKKVIHEVKKIHPSKFEDSPISGLNMKSGKELFAITTSKGKFSVLICDDFRHHGKDVQKHVQMIFVPSYNKKPRNFSNRASILVEDYHKYVFISNPSKCGYSGIYGILDKIYLEKLNEEGFIPNDAPNYEICALKPNMEAMIVACFNLKRMSVEVPTKVLDHYANVREIKVVNEDGEEIKNIYR